MRLTGYRPSTPDSDRCSENGSRGVRLLFRCRAGRRVALGLLGGEPFLVAVEQPRLLALHVLVGTARLGAIALVVIAGLGTHVSYSMIGMRGRSHETCRLGRRRGGQSVGREPIHASRVERGLATASAVYSIPCVRLPSPSRLARSCSPAPSWRRPRRPARRSPRRPRRPPGRRRPRSAPAPGSMGPLAAPRRWATCKASRSTASTARRSSTP